MNLLDGCSETALANGLQWLNDPPEVWTFDDRGLTIVPRPLTDFFRGPNHSADNAAFLYRNTTGDFTVSTRVSGKLVGFGDAAALTVRSSDTRWAKLCMERSPLGEVSIVSVVTNEWSDDANGELLDRPECHLRLTRKGTLLGMHYSVDGEVWRFVRALQFELPATVMLGVHAQAPFRGGCETTFHHLHYSSDAVNDFRSGE